MATSVNKPAVTLNIIGGDSTIDNTPQKILVFGQITDGVSSPGVLVKDVQANQEDALFGTFSNSADIIRNVRKYNTVNSIDVMPFADGTDAAEALIQCTDATITAAVTIYISVGSEADHRTKVNLAKDDTEDNVATAIAAAINAMNTGSSKCPFTAEAATDTVTVTCIQQGAIGNSMSIKMEVPPDSGLAFNLTDFAGGADTLDLNGYFDLINDRYQTVIWPFNDSTENIAVIEEFLGPRFNASKKVLDGVSISSVLDPDDDLTVDINSKDIVVLASKKIADPDTVYAMGAEQCEKEYAKAAQVAALRALRLTEDASLTRYQTTNAPADQFGGMGISTLPYFNTILPSMPKSGPYGYTEEEQDDLTAKGYSFIGNTPSGSGVVIGDLITTYGFDGGGNPDPQWSHLNNVDAMSVAREYFFNNLRKRFAQSRLTGGRTVAGRSIADKDIIEAYCSNLNQDLGELGITEIGETVVDGVTIDAGQFFNDNLSVVLDTSEGKVTINAVLLIVGQLRTILGTLQLSFSS